MGANGELFAMLPSKYQLPQMPASIDFEVAGFEQSYPRGGLKTLALEPRDCRRWFDEFTDRVVAAIGKEYLPVCRLADGEFLFLLGEQPWDFRLPWTQRLRLTLGRLKHDVLLRGGVGPFTAGHYHSGYFSAGEWREARLEAPALVRNLSLKGILAWHFIYAPEPFHERFFPALEKWLIKHDISVNGGNYFPFYFVYAILTGRKRAEILAGRRILVVNGAKGEKKEKTIAGLRREGAAEIYWCPISTRRSYFDRVEIGEFVGKVDLVLVGAGIGKLKIIPQLEPLRVPCLDAGYVFEVWADPRNKFKRVWCAADEDWAAIGSNPYNARI